MESIGVSMNISVKLRIVLEMCISCFLLVCYFLFCIFQADMIEQTLALALDQTLFPRAITITVIIMCFLLFYDSIRLFINYKKGILTPEIHEYYECSEESIPIGRILIYIGILFAYLIGLYYIGFMYSTPVITLCIAWLLGIKRIFVAAISAVIFTVALYYASFYGLQIMLPSGVLFY